MTENSSTEATAGNDVFVSYASQDNDVANAMVEALEKRKVKCWIAPRDVRAGAQYADAIVRAITGAKTLVLVLSEHAIASSHVGKEVERASSKKHPIIALRIDTAPLTPAFEYFLSESQWVEAQSGRMDAAYARLIEAIRAPDQTAPSNFSDATPGLALAKASPAQPTSHRTRLLLGAGFAILAALIAGLWAGQSWLTRHSAPAAPAAPIAPAAPGSTTFPVAAAVSEKSIAVLPFVDMSEKHDQEYFSDGLSEELIDHLAHNPDLKVIARTSSFAFKGKNEDMRSIAGKLGVANLLEGSVRKSGGELRITAQLIRAADGVHLWSEIYDRKLTDIFKVQNEISTTVAKALNAALNTTSAALVQSAYKGTSNIAAYNLLLQGNYFFSRGNKDDTSKATKTYQQVLKLDPHYALGWGMLARAYAWQGYIGELTAAEAEIKGRDAAERALAIDPNLAVAYYARGNIFRLVAGDWAAATSDFERAVALDPHGEAGISAQGNILILKGAMSGRFDDKIDWTRRFLQRSPLDAGQLSDLAWYQQISGSLEESAVNYRKLLELNPAYATAQGLYAVTLLLLGKDADALAAAERESDEASKLLALACVYWAMDRRSDSDAAVAALERGFADRNQYAVAAAHAFRGESDAAFAWLERTYQQRRGYLEELKVDPLFRKLHGDPRFNALLRKAKLLE